MDATRYPIDFDALNKGDIIPVERLEKISGKKYGSVAFALFSLNLKEQIRRELAGRGLIVAIRSDDGALHILTDIEQSPYSSDAVHRHIRGAMNHYQTLAATNVAQLPDEERVLHERRVLRDGKYIQALAQARTALRTLRHERTVPGLPSSEVTEGNGHVSGTDVRDHGSVGVDAAQLASVRSAQ